MPKVLGIETLVSCQRFQGKPYSRCPKQDELAGVPGNCGDEMP